MSISLPSKNLLLLKIIIVIASGLLLFLLNGISSSLDKSIEKVFALTWGEDQPDSNIVIIHISSSDIENIGPWPIKRYYYALLINTLSNYNVKSIGLEVFLSAKFVTQTLYDNLLVKEINKAGNVVLSSVAGNVKKENNKYVTDSLSFPSPKLLDEDFITGHLNFIGDERLQIPLVIHSQDILEKAFSLHLANNKNYTNEKLMHVNFISSWKKFTNYTLIEFFDMVQNNDGSLNSLNDKIVIIGISDPQIAVNIETYFEENIPGTALHAFAVDNLLHERFFNDNWLIVSIIFFPLFLIGFIFLQSRSKINIIIFYLIFLTLFLIISFIFFSIFNLLLSYSFFFLPLILLALSDIYFFTAERKFMLKGAMDETIILKSLLNNKEAELYKLQKELDAAGIESSSLLADQIKKLKSDIEKIREKEEDETKAELSSVNQINNFYGIIYKSKIISSIVDLIKITAPEEANILVLGESGTGKELAARAIHQLSKRSSNNFVAVNCGALSDTLLESELFGHVKGAFTGAVADKVGRFEAADKGTIFLDEIAETSENFQVKLLRVIQTGDYEKVGSSKTFHTDVRIVAATNKNLEAAVNEKKFREDLYYRLNVIKVELPPLRERREDIEALAKHFIEKESSILNLSRAALDALMNYSWKGNVRELEAVIKRAVIFSKAAKRNLIQLADLPDEIIKDYKFDFEDLVIESLRNKNFSHSAITETAKELGNVNRTLVSENFRGFALKILVENNFDVDASVKIISISDEEEVNEKVKTKIETFLRNIENDTKNIHEKNFDSIKTRLASKYKNLPQKFHVYLDEVIKKGLNG